MAIEDNIVIPDEYKPQLDSKYMSPMMLAYFRDKLLTWRSKLIAKENEASGRIHEGLGREPDHVDAAVTETFFEQELLPYVNMEENLIAEIDRALTKIDQGNYGYCEETSESIGVDRLEAWPIARLCVEMQREQEQKK